MNEIERLQAWYQSQSDGEWEHAWGVKIETLDNPGWRIEIDLVGTGLAERPFAKVSRGSHEDEVDWVHCEVEGGRFRGAGGAKNLTELISIFLTWATT
jgi:hypothetical protein